MTDLQRALEQASELIDWPKRDLTDRIRHRIISAPPPRRQVWVWARVAAVTAVVLLLLMATPWGRQAIADILGVAGITIVWGEPTPPIGTELDLGDAVTLDEAIDGVPFPLHFPDYHPVGDPVALYLSDLPISGAVHMVWESAETLPSAGDTGIGVLYSQFRVVGAEVFLKSLDDEHVIEEVEIRGEEGFWVGGNPHMVIYRDLEGVVHEETGRLAGNVLIWEEDGVTHRIETTLQLEETMALAESLRPAGVSGR